VVHRMQGHVPLSISAITLTSGLFITSSLSSLSHIISSITSVFVTNFSASFDALGVFTADSTAGVLLTTSLPNNDEDEDASAIFCFVPLVSDRGSVSELEQNGDAASKSSYRGDDGGRGE